MRRTLMTINRKLRNEVELKIKQRVVDLSKVEAKFKKVLGKRRKR